MVVRTPGGQAWPPRRVLGAGSEIGPYRIESLLGQGGMGVVYRARDLRLDRPVALKLLSPELAGDGRFRARFERESRLAASIDHAGIVPVYEAGDADGVTYIAMRYVEGSDLAQLLAQRGPARAGAGARPRRPARRRARRGARPRAHPPRRQAQQRAGGARGSRLPRRLRAHEDERPGLGDGQRAGGRHRRLHGAGGHPRRGADAVLGPLRAGVRAVRVPDRRACRTRDRTPRPSSTGTSSCRRRACRSCPAFDAVFARALAKDPAKRFGSGAELVAAARAALGARSRAVAAARASRWSRRRRSSPSPPPSRSSCGPTAIPASRRSGPTRPR